MVQNADVRREFPIVYLMAMDYLPIQATSVPAECVFSSAGETDTPCRRRIGPALMEALQILKFLLKHHQLLFISHHALGCAAGQADAGW